MFDSPYNLTRMDLSETQRANYPGLHKVACPLGANQGIRYYDGPIGIDSMGVSKEAKDAVGFLCVDETTPQGIIKTPIGTCFFVVVYNEDKSAGYSYLVTAKHVYKDYVDDGAPLYVRLNKFGTIAQGKSGVTYVPLESNWYSHPDPNVDLGVLPFALDPNVTNGAIYCTIALDKIIANQQQLITLGIDWPPGEAEEILIIAMMYQYIGQERNHPVIRTGRIALVTDELIEGGYGPSNYYLIESQVYQGNSGAPVYVAFQMADGKRPMFLLGLLVSGFPAKQLEIVDNQTKGAAETIAYYNLGISFVVPVEKLVELLTSQEMVEIRKKGEPRPQKPVAVGRPTLTKQTITKKIEAD